MAPRAGASAAANDAKRRKREEVAREPPAKVPKTDLDVVREELLVRDAGVSEGRKLLADALEFAVSAEHAFQREMLDLIESSLRENIAETTTALRDADGSVEAAEAAASEAHGATAEAEAAAAAARAVAADRKSQLEVETKKVKASAIDHAEAEAEVQPVIDEQQAAETEYAQVKSLLEASLKPLAAGELSDSDMAAAAKKVLACLTSHRVEKALLAAAQAALKTPVAERGPFDDITLQNVERKVVAQLADVERRMAEAGPNIVAAKAMALGSWAILDCAKDDEAAARRALAEATAQLRLAEAEAAAKANAEAARNSVVQKAQQRRATLSTRLEAAEASVEAFRRLLPSAAAGGEQDGEVSNEKVTDVSQAQVEGTPSKDKELASVVPAVVDLPTPSRA